MSEYSTPTNLTPVTPNELGTALRNGRLLALIFVCLLIVFVYGYMQRAATAAELRAQITQMENQIVEANFRTAQLEAELRYVASDDFLDKIAREELGLAKPGETALIILDPGTSAGREQDPTAGADANIPEILRAPDSTDFAQPPTLAAGSGRAGGAGASQQPIWQAWLDLFALSLSR